jgi:hypothetical protein
MRSQCVVPTRRRWNGLKASLGIGEDRLCPGIIAPQQLMKQDALKVTLGPQFGDPEAVTDISHSDGASRFKPRDLYTRRLASRSLREAGLQRQQLSKPSCVITAAGALIRHPGELSVGVRVDEAGSDQALPEVDLARSQHRGWRRLPVGADGENSPPVE